MPCPACPHCLARGAYGVLDPQDPALTTNVLRAPRPARPTRYVLEGTWSGYRSGQRRVVHREVLKPYQANGYTQLTGIRFSDGTLLEVAVRAATPREKVAELHGYDRLLSAAYYQKLNGIVSVEDIKL